MAGGRFKEFLKKYGKIGLGVHFTVSAASITGLYVAIKNNVDVESMLEKVGMPSLAKEKKKDSEIPNFPSESSMEETTIATSDSGFVNIEKEEPNRTTELVASSGGALALAVLINKALLPVRVPVTFALTPPIARFLTRRNLIKTS